MDPETIHDEWQVESDEQIFDSSLSEMTARIKDGSLLRIDRVRKGNLRWIEAGKVPVLTALFDERDGATMRSVVTTISSPVSVPTPSQPTGTESKLTLCSVHPDATASFECETCSNKFCKACPNSFGGTVKICPFCGAMCRPLAQTEQHPYRKYAPTSHFGFGDFTKALSYPLRFPASLIMGSVMFAFLSVGQSVNSLGGAFMMWGAIACYILSNTMTFGILAHTVENFAQGKLQENFMPSFDDFSMWEDAVHPFFLMIGVNLVSFGPLAAVVLFAVFAFGGRAAVGPDPVTPATTIGNVGQGIKLADTAKQQSVAQGERIHALNDLMVPQTDRRSADTLQEQEDKDRIEKFAADTQSMRDKAPASDARVADSKLAIASNLVQSGPAVTIALLVGIAWALFFFPAASAVAAYTRSLSAVLNITVGLDTIRRLGATYAKVLVMFITLAIVSAIVTAGLNLIFVPFDSPMLGNIPAAAVGSFFTFYVAIVFAYLLGTALFKCADNLQLPQG